MTILIPIATIIAFLAILWIVWRFGHRNLPCPTALIGLLDNPFTRGYYQSVPTRLNLKQGDHVLDAGCGPGLLTVPMAQAVAPGRVMAVDIQAAMIDRAKESVQRAGLNNVDFLVAGLGEGRLPKDTFDRAVLSTVLGEIPDKQMALREIYFALKPGGILSVMEVLPDPDYQSAGKVKAMAAEVGFRDKSKSGSFLAFILNLEKPAT